MHYLIYFINFVSYIYVSLKFETRSIVAIAQRAFADPLVPLSGNIYLMFAKCFT